MTKFLAGQRVECHLRPGRVRLGTVLDRDAAEIEFGFKIDLRKGLPIEYDDETSDFLTRRQVKTIAPDQSNASEV